MQKRLQELSQQVQDSQEHCLKGDGKPAGLMKAVILKYGEDLSGLVAVAGLQSATVNFRRHRLRVTGSSASLDTVSQQLLTVRDYSLYKKPSVILRTGTGAGIEAKLVTSENSKKFVTLAQKVTSSLDHHIAECVFKGRTYFVTNILASYFSQISWQYPQVFFFYPFFNFLCAVMIVQKQHDTLPPPPPPSPPHSSICISDKRKTLWELSLLMSECMSRLRPAETSSIYQI